MAKKKKGEKKQAVAEETAVAPAKKSAKAKNKEAEKEADLLLAAAPNGDAPKPKKLKSRESEVVTVQDPVPQLKKEKKEKKPAEVEPVAETAVATRGISSPLRALEENAEFSTQHSRIDDYFHSSHGPVEIKEHLLPKTPPKYRQNGKLDNQYYEAELARLQEELVKLQYWVAEKGLRVVIIFEGRSGAGKGGVIKRITERTSPRIVRVVALPTPSDREKTQWWFQKYVAYLPAGGEMVLFDRSWYNRALVEPVMGFCTEEQYREFLRSCPQFERMLVRSGIILLKYWFSVSDEEQEKRFQARVDIPYKRWKLSPMDLEDRRRWVEYSKAKDRMFDYTDLKQAPWYVVNADDKKKARLNCITHILSAIPYEDITPPPVELPPREENTGYIRPPITEQTFVPSIY
jgi:polyphosphate kinase